MEEKLSMAKEILSKYGQEHLLQKYNELSKKEQNKLKEQLLEVVIY